MTDERASDFGARANGKIRKVRQLREARTHVASWFHSGSPRSIRAEDVSMSNEQGHQMQSKAALDIERIRRLWQQRASSYQER